MSLKRTAITTAKYLPQPVLDALRPIYKTLTGAAERSRFLSIYSSFVNEGDLVFDIGAHMGDHTAIFEQLGARVLAVEPNPRCIKSMRKRFNGKQGITLLESGVSSSEGELPFYICKNRPTVSSFSLEHRDKRFADEIWEQERVVPVTTMEKIVEKYGTPSFCKIDVEGFESEVLSGLSGPIPVLMFEFHRALFSDTEKCLEILTVFDTVSYNVLPGGCNKLVLSNWGSSEDLLTYLNEHNVVNGDILVRAQRA